MRDKPEPFTVRPVPGPFARPPVVCRACGSHVRASVKGACPACGAMLAGPVGA